MGNGCCCCCPKTGYNAMSPQRKSSASLGSERASPEIVVPQKADQYKAQENPNKPRFGHIGISSQNTAKLIEGYEKEPVVSLEEALEPFHGQIDQLPERIKEAKTKCYYPSKHQLTRDESAAIYIYSMNWRETNVHDKLQAALKSGNQAEAKRWFKFLKLYKSALDKLPEAKETVWQGTAYDEQKKKLLTSGDQPLYIGLGSCSPSDKALKKQLERDGIGRKLLVGYGPFVKAKDVTSYTAGDQEEYAIFPGSKVAKADVQSDPDGTVYTHFTNKFSKSHSRRYSHDETDIIDTFNNMRNSCTVPVLLRFYSYHSYILFMFRKRCSSHFVKNCASSFV